MADSPVDYSKVKFFAWALYDWANSAFSAVIQTFVFAAFFTQHVARDEITGNVEWGWVNGIAGIVIALTAPMLGAIADHGKRRKVWIICLTYICITATSLLWFVKPDPSFTYFALGTVGIGIITCELAFVFYNAMLVGISPPEKLGRWSGWGWGFGYAGGVACLLLAYMLFVDENALISIDRTELAHVRATFPLVGIWYALFSIPLFLLVPDTSGKGKNPMRAIRDGLKELKETLVHMRHYRHIVKFLIARIFYMDGLNTLFVFAGSYSAALFGMSAGDLLLFGISLNISAGVGAVCFAWLDDLIGGKKLILISLTGLILPIGGILIATSQLAFWMLGLFAGIFVGPIQAASRSFMARIVPKNLINEMFGFFALSGKVTAFIGPLLVSWVTLITNSQRAGMSVIFFYLAIGFLIMLTVRPAKNNSDISSSETV